MLYRVPMLTQRLKFAPIAICLAFGLAACGDDAKTDSTTGASDTTAASETSATDAVDTTVDDSTDTSATDAPDTSVDDDAEGDDVVLSDSTFGPILTDGEGNALYLYTPDGADTPTCTGGCASAWPALVTDDDHVHAGEGLDEDLFTIVDGPNGMQLSYNGHPLYYFAGDSAPGDTNGQGSGGVWFLLDAEGNQITA